MQDKQTAQECAHEYNSEVYRKISHTYGAVGKWHLLAVIPNSPRQYGYTGRQRIVYISCEAFYCCSPPVLSAESPSFASDR